VGLFSLSEEPHTIAVSWKDLGLAGRRVVRDLWRQRDLGVFDGRFETNLSRHGVALLRLSPAR